MHFDFFIGIDVSKNELDFSVVKSATELFHMETANSLDGIRAFIKKLKSEPGFDFDKCVFCMEHTGIYNNHLLDYLTKKKASVCVEPGAHIKQSSGLQRGKNDRVDALRIALYAYKNKEGLKLWQPKREVIKRLKALTALRSRMVNAIKQLRTPLEEEDDFIDSNIHKRTKKLCDASIKTLESDLKKIEKEIDDTMKSDEELNRLFSIVSSVDGIGAVTATQIILLPTNLKILQKLKSLPVIQG